MALVYIIGPYAPADVGTDENVFRATLVGALALRSGLIPIIPHLTIGKPALCLRSASSIPVDVEQVARGAGYEWDGGGLAGALARNGVECGLVWAILRDDGTPSLGTAAELSQFPSTMVRALRWADWSEQLRLAGLNSDFMQWAFAAGLPGMASHFPDERQVDPDDVQDDYYGYAEE